MAKQDELSKDASTNSETDVVGSKQTEDVTDTEKVFQPSEPKEKTAQRERIATEVFAKNHRKSVLYFTSDMIPFFEKTDAIKHIKGLDDKTIVTVNKE